MPWQVRGHDCWVELVDGSTAYTSYLPERGFPAFELTSAYPEAINAIYGDV